MSNSNGPAHAAHYFNGRDASVADAEISIAGETFRARVGDRDCEWPLADIRRSTVVAGVPLRLAMPDGSSFVLDRADADFGAIDAAPEQFVHRLERNPVAVVIALIAIAAFVVVAYRSGIPWLADTVAKRIPIEAESALGTTTLSALDSAVLSPSKFSEARHADLENRFRYLVERGRFDKEPRLIFRDSPRYVGANALTLPGGTVVITDELIVRVESLDEMSAVFAHELGHIAHRHTMRQLLEQSASGLVLGALIGDVSGIGSLAAAAPAVLLGLQFSRETEEQADDYALELLARAGIPRSALVSALQTLVASRCSDAKAADDKSTEECARGSERTAMPQYLSTHPDIDARIKRARAAAEIDKK